MWGRVTPLRKKEMEGLAQAAQRTKWVYASLYNYVNPKSKDADVKAYSKKMFDAALEGLDPLVPEVKSYVSKYYPKVRAGQRIRLLANMNRHSPALVIGKIAVFHYMEPYKYANDHCDLLMHVSLLKKDGTEGRKLKMVMDPYNVTGMFEVLD